MHRVYVFRRATPLCQSNSQFAPALHKQFKHTHIPIHSGAGDVAEVGVDELPDVADEPLPARVPDDSETEAQTSDEGVLSSSSTSNSEASEVEVVDVPEVPQVHIGRFIVNSRYVYRAECPDTHPIGRIWYWANSKSFECYRRSHKTPRCRWAAYPSTHGGHPTDYEGAVWIARGLAADCATCAQHMDMRQADLVDV